MPWHHAALAAGPCLAASTAFYNEKAPVNVKKKVQVEYSGKVAVSVARLSVARSPAATLVRWSTLILASFAFSRPGMAARNPADEEIIIPAIGYAGRTPSPAPVVPAPMASTPAAHSACSIALTAWYRTRRDP